MKKESFNKLIDPVFGNENIVHVHTNLAGVILLGEHDPFHGLLHRVIRCNDGWRLAT